MFASTPHRLCIILWARVRVVEPSGAFSTATVAFFSSLSATPSHIHRDSTTSSLATALQDDDELHLQLPLEGIESTEELLKEAFECAPRRRITAVACDLESLIL